MPFYLGRGAGQLDIEDVVLYQRSQLPFLDQFVEGVEDGSVGGDIVKDTGHGVSPALYHHMFDAGVMPGAIIIRS